MGGPDDDGTVARCRRERREAYLDRVRAASDAHDEVIERKRAASRVPEETIVEAIVKSVLLESVEKVRLADEQRKAAKIARLEAKKPQLNFRVLPLSRKAVEDHWRKILPNIRRTQFQKAIQRHKKHTVRRKIGAVFDVLDANRDGRLTTVDIKRALALSATDLDLRQFPILRQILRPRYISWSLHRMFKENAVVRDAFVDFVLRLREEEAQREALLGIFRALDVDGSGSLSWKEILKGLALNAVELLPQTSHFPVLHRVLAHPRAIETSLAKLGMNKSRELEYEEFYKLVLQMTEEEAERIALLRVFHEMDRNGDGRLSETEVLHMIVLKEALVRPLLAPFPVLQMVLQPTRLRETFHQFADEGAEITAGAFISMVQVARYDHAETQCLDTIFGHLDRDKSGTLTAKEAKRVLALDFATVQPYLDNFPVLATVMKPRNLEREMKAADTDERGYLLKRDFVQLLRRLRVAREESIVLDRIFDVLDKDGDGSLSIQEIQRGLTLSSDVVLPMLLPFPLIKRILRPKRVRTLFRDIDTDGSGTITKDEFTAYIQRVRTEHVERVALADLFRLLDTDRSHDISVKEIKRALVLRSAEIRPLLKPFPQLAAVLKPKYVSRLFLLANKNDADALVFDDFLQIVRRVRREHEEAVAFQQVFDYMDKDGDAILTLREIKLAFMTHADRIAALLEPFPALRAVLRPKHLNAACSRYHIDSRSSLTLEAFRRFVQALRTEYEEKEALRCIFAVFDQSGDGTLSRTEVQRALLLKSKEILPLLKLFPVLQSTLQHPADLDRVFDLADKDRNDSLTVDEFMDLVWCLRAEQAERKALECVFACIDRDGNGTLSMREWKRATVLHADELESLLSGFPVLQSVLLNPRTVAEAFKRADADGDGSIVFEEFCTFLVALRKERVFEQCIHRIFVLVDNDGSESVTRRELQRALVMRMEDVRSLCLDVPDVWAVLSKPARLVAYFETADDDKSGDIDATEFLTIVQALLAQKDAPGTEEENDDDDDASPLRILTEEEEALLNVWNLLTGSSPDPMSKRILLHSLESNFPARRMLRKVHSDFETALRMEHFTDVLLLWNAPAYADAFWLKQKQMKFGQVNEGEFILAGQHALKTFRREREAQRRLRFVVRIQALCRGFVLRQQKHRATEALREQRRARAVVELQRVWRGHVGRCRAQRFAEVRRRTISAGEIQRVWRGYTGRQRAQHIADEKAAWGVA